MSCLKIHAQILIDGIHDEPRFNQLIVCKDHKIIEIKDYEPIQDALEVHVVTPGFFNCHVHILDPVGGLS